MGARRRHAFQSVASFYAKRLILVEQLEKNALNKEIRRSFGIEGPAVNGWLTAFRARLLQEAVTTTASPSGASTTFNPQACANSRV